MAIAQFVLLQPQFHMAFVFAGSIVLGITFLGDQSDPSFSFHQQKRWLHPCPVSGPGVPLVGPREVAPSRVQFLARLLHEGERKFRSSVSLKTSCSRSFTSETRCQTLGKARFLLLLCVIILFYCIYQRTTFQHLLQGIQKCIIFFLSCSIGASVM